MTRADVLGLMATVRDAIERVDGQRSGAELRREVSRALAHLWSAYDELELLARTERPLPALPPAASREPRALADAFG